MSQDAAVDRAPSGQEIADWVRQRIRTGRFVPGQRLVEVDIIRQTGASRSKVREALKRLEGEGLVEIEEFRGASVRSSTLDEVRQIYRARMALEGMAAHDFTVNADSETLDRLKALQDQLDACVRERAPDRFGRLNNEWHRLIVEGSGNKVIADHLQRLNVPIHRLLFESFYDEERLKTANADHQAMLALILAGDADGAERAMRQHIGDGFETLARIEDEFYR
ncbi:GntR family transcriptional regulator (plasmid) [Novosphingobium sp. THN1]|jgi:DNA-binding GntR family transcriptional regulator|uniref:GntR family transcriptional regulator n=1 Tax=unclassified Novosphingobium TaxID=2644732 RepID=UPI000E4CFF22|nr:MULTISPECIES: GntR family transcriptional regulator [unclassified Novosphingobium]AXU21157.1 GntR family transcriptional regulator [Novosphingobium sp. THN1]NLR39667.1 GntR family transcriptional regulator [Novosphingobium sp. ERW19]